MNTADIDVVKKLYSGINQNDIDSVMKLLAENIVRVEPDDFPVAGTFKGHSELREHLIKGRSTWAEGSCTPVEFSQHQNRIVALVHVHVRIKDETKWIDAYIADGFSLENGKITEFHSFTSKEKALHWAAAAL
ncbi:nuclear transport factor 2 family protein [Bdellovibrio sp. HCB209]|uniref:nuclear transport factor 2 family protein n=1 Tax=Bdellovibrio sp. HCB209 TaxID=3394354 RepID=UPI0039B614DA